MKSRRISLKILAIIYRIIIYYLFILSEFISLFNEFLIYEVCFKNEVLTIFSGVRNFSFEKKNTPLESLIFRLFFHLVTIFFHAFFYSRFIHFWKPASKKSAASPLINLVTSSCNSLQIYNENLIFKVTLVSKQVLFSVYFSRLRIYVNPFSFLYQRYLSLLFLFKQIKNLT